MDDDPYPSMLLLAEIVEVSAGFWLINGLFFIALLVFSALISGSEVAFFSLQQQDLRDLQAKGDEKSQLVLKLVSAPQRLLGTILILNVFLKISLVTLSTFMSWTYFGSQEVGMAAVISQAVVVVLLLVFLGDVIPRSYANDSRLGYARSLAQTLYVFSFILSPLSSLLNGISHVMERRIEKKGYSLSVNELQQALEITSETTTTEEKDILKGIVNFGTLTVRQVMQSRMDLTAVDITMDFNELMDKINKSGYSRIPVYNDTIDHIEGILYIKDLLNHIDKEEDFEWQKLIRKAMFVPEYKKV